MQDSAAVPRAAASLATVVVNIIRNQFTPVFSGTPPYEQTIDQAEFVGANVFTVIATDNDPLVSLLVMMKFLYAKKHLVTLFTSCCPKFHS